MSRMRRTGARPSPAIVVAILALVAALAGTAVAADPTATSSAINKKKVKKIAKKEINKAAAGLSVDNADNLGGDPASAYLKDNKVRFAEVNANGTIGANTKGISQANVNRESAGFYCIDGLNPAPKGVSATLDTSALSGARLYAGIKEGPGVCAGKQAIIQTQNNALTNTDNPFTIVVF